MTQRTRRHALGLALTLFFSLGALNPAEVKAAESAEAAYEAGKAKLKSGDTAGAIDAFKAGLGLAGTDEGRRRQLILALGLSFDRAGEPAHAIESYQRFLDQTKAHGDILSPKWRNRRELVAQDIKKLEARIAATHGYVTVLSEPAGAAISLGGVRAGATQDLTSPAGFYLAQGNYRVTLSLDGFEPAQAQIRVSPGGMSPIKVTLSAVTPALKAPARHPDTLTDQEALTTKEVTASSGATLSAEVSLGQSPSLGPWMLIASGGALVIAGGVTSALALSAHGEYEDYVSTIPAELPSEGERERIFGETEALSDEVDMYTAMSGALLGVGVGAAVGGLIWMLMTPEDTPAEVSLRPLPGGLSAQAQWRF